MRHILKSRNGLRKEGTTLPKFFLSTKFALYMLELKMFGGYICTELKKISGSSFFEGPCNQSHQCEASLQFFLLRRLHFCSFRSEAIQSIMSDPADAAPKGSIHSAIDPNKTTLGLGFILICIGVVQVTLY
jgi:hypothetical protein